MKDSAEHDEELFYEQQERADELFKQLKEDLKLDDAQATKCLVDWVYINAEVDYLATAAEKDDARSTLSEFMVEAALAWVKEQQRRKIPKTRLSVDEALEAFSSFADAIKDIGR